MNVRLAEFSAITGRPRETIRNMTKADTLPWQDDAPGDGAQRRYDGFHALAMVATEILHTQGYSMAQAAEFVLSQQRLLSIFLAGIDEDAVPAALFVTAFSYPEEDSWTGFHWVPSLGGGGYSEDIIDRLTKDLDRVGETYETRKGRSTSRIVGGPHVATVFLPEAYRLLRQRAKAAGYLVDGSRIIRLPLNGEA